MPEQRRLVNYREQFEKCPIWLFDLDNTAIDTNASAGIGKRYLAKEWQKHHYRNVAIGAYGALRTLMYMAMGDERRGLQEFISALNHAGCVDEKSAQIFADKTIRKHAMPDLKNVIMHLKARKKIPIIYTGGLDVSALAAKDEFGFDHSFAAYSVSEGAINPSEYSRNGSKKTTARAFLRTLGAEIRDCVAVGDSETDMPVFECAGLAIAAPLAKPAIKEAADLWARSYGDLYMQLNQI